MLHIYTHENKHIQEQQYESTHTVIMVLTKITLQTSYTYSFG